MVTALSMLNLAALDTAQAGSGTMMRSKETSVFRNGATWKNRRGGMVMLPRYQPTRTKLTAVFCSLVVAVVLGGGTTGTVAQGVPYDNDVILMTECASSHQEPNQVLIQVTLQIDGGLPEHWVGWVIDRFAVGQCEEVQVTEVLPFLDGMSQHEFSDDLTLADLYHGYRIQAVDAEGTRYHLPFPLFPLGRGYDFAVCGGGPAARGTVHDLGWTLGLEVCPDECWVPISFLELYPPEMESLVGTGEIVDVYGMLDTDFEGPYILVDRYEIVTDCVAVVITPRSWTAVKGVYR
jgi:hypothetical protein